MKKKLVLLLSSMVVLSSLSVSLNTYIQAEESSSVSNQFIPGTYQVKVDGRGGEIIVDVTFDEVAIRDIEIVSQSETAGLGDVALETIKNEIIANQSLDVEVVSGASEASNAIIEAVELAIEQSGGNPELMKKKTDKKSDEVIELTTDVVVIGGGASGTSAAIAAADEGAKVILVEKTGVIGGASNYSWAGKFYNSSAALAEDVEVDLEGEINEWIEFNHWRVDASVIRRFVKESGNTYDWLKEKGYETKFLNFMGEQLHVLPDMASREQTLRKMLADSVEKNGGEIYTKTTAEHLLTDESGAVTGVVAVQDDGTTLNIHSKNVIIATGGYAGNAEMVLELFGFGGINGGLSQNIGEGLQMAWEAGAKVPVNLGGQMLHQTLTPATSKLKKEFSPFEASYPVMTSYLPQFLNVGPSGARFRNEEATMEAVAAANTSAFQGPFHYVIISQDQITKLEEAGMKGLGVENLPGMPPEFYFDFTEQFTLENPWKNATHVFDQMVENGNGFKGDTIEELAEVAGMDVRYFTESFESYQKAIKDGEDLDFGKAAQYLVPMEEGPYYAVRAEINNLGSVGGLVVNNKFQVLDENNLPLKGLYAVGLEAEGVLFSDTYVGNGIGVGFSFTSGRLGGMEAAKELVQE